jgi:hypothetical protein
MTAELHLAIDALTLQLLLERAQRLVDIIVANDDLHKKPSNSLQKHPKSTGQARRFGRMSDPIFAKQ